MERDFHFIILGATGFTGKFVTKTMAKNAGSRRWAIAGRNEAKLKELLEEVAAETGIDCLNVECFICDVNDYHTLLSVTEKARIILNCVGPYRLYGEPVVKACVEKSTDYVDISGEPFFMESMALKYDIAAEEKGCFIVSACGFGCVPTDMGVQYAEKNFNGILDAVEAYHEFHNPNGISIHTGTLESFMLMLSDRADLKVLRKIAASDKPTLPKSSFKLPLKGPIFYNDTLKSWCMPFLGSDRSVIYRTNMFLYMTKKRRPIQLQTYVKMPNFFTAMFVFVCAIYFYAMTRFAFGQRLMSDFPELFTFGLITKKGPSKKQLETATSRTHIFGHGWSSDSLKHEEIGSRKPHDRTWCVLDAPDSGYIATSAMMVACAITMLEDRKNLPFEGGVLTTGSAFSATNLIDRLEEFGVLFQKID